MRLVTVLLVALLALVQWDLWWGKGGMARVQALQSQLGDQQRRNEQARQSNDQLAAELADLKNGLEMVEEKARAELGMVKPDEILVQVSAAKPR